MSWYQSMAGAPVRLSPSVEHRIGVAGFGVDDVGVLREPETVATVLTLGSKLEAISEQELDRFVTLAHGSPEQVTVAQDLGQRGLAALGRRIEKRVQRKLSGVPGTEQEAFAKFREWAQRSAWELPVGCLDDYPYKCFCIADDSGLSVFECAVARVPGSIGDVLTTLVHEFCVEALKTPALEAISYTVFMAFEPEYLSRYEGFEAMRTADGVAVLEWLEKVAPDVYSELSYWEGSEEERAATASVLRDIAFAHHDEWQRIKRVVGNQRPRNPDERPAFIERIRRAAENCDPGELRDFAVAACDLLRGPTTRELIDRLPDDERCERIPGDLSVLDTGVSMEDIGDYYQYINETALNGDEIAVLPLNGDPDCIVDLLVRITTFERLILALGALIESGGHLSAEKAA
jgi:hypothetical protein